MASSMHHGVVQSSQCAPSKFLYKPFFGSGNNVQMVVLKLGHHAWRAALVSSHANKGLEYMYVDHVA